MLIIVYSIIDADYVKAIELYSQAIEKWPRLAAYYGNRSFAYIKTEMFGLALTDATMALQLDRSYIKVGCFNSGL